MNDPKQPIPPAGAAPSPAERNALKRRGHALKAQWVMGRTGLSDAFVRQVSEALGVHGLIKVRIAADDATATRNHARALADRAGGHVIQVVGRVVLLYRATAGKHNTREPS